MSSGYRRDPIEFQYWTEGYDASGFPIAANWAALTPALKAWGRYKPNRDDDYWAAQQQQSDVAGLIEVPYIPRLVKLLMADLTKLRVKMCAGVPPDDVPVTVPPTPPNPPLFRYFTIDSYFDPTQRRKVLHLMVKEELLT